MTHFTTEGARTAKPGELAFFEKVAVLATGITVPKPEVTWDPRDDGLEYESFGVPGYRSTPLTVWHFAGSGSGRVFVLWHGYAGERGQLRRETRELARAGHDVYLADFHGSGLSGGSTTSIGYHEAEDVRAVHEVVRARHPDRAIVLYGVSMGANAILNAVALHDVRPDAAILSSPFSSLLATTSNRFRVMGLPAFPFARCLTFWGGVQQGFDALGYEPREFASRVEVPVLLLHGSSDANVLTADARRLFDSLAGPKRWVLFEESGHECFLLTEPGKWRESVDSFLASL